MKIIIIVIIVIIILILDIRGLKIGTIIKKIPSIVISLLSIYYIYQELNDSKNNIEKKLVVNDVYKNLKNENKKNKRRVTNLQKKYIGSQQGWRCKICKKQLDYTYEVDHIKSLEDGGNNDINNLQALCRNCHGKKTIDHYL